MTDLVVLPRKNEEGGDQIGEIEQGSHKCEGRFGCVEGASKSEFKPGGEVSSSFGTHSASQ